MSHLFDETLIEKATSRLSQFPGFGAGVSRRDSLRTIICGMLAGVGAPAVAAPAQRAPGVAGAGPDIGRVAADEELLVCTFTGDGRFGASVENLRYITLNMTMYDLEGKAIGAQHGVHDSLSDLPYMLSTPPTPAPMFDEPPVPVVAAQEWTKGIWSFTDGSAVYAVGPARTHIIPFWDGSLLFTVTTGQTITGGIGRYKNAYGVKQATGSAFIPASIVQSGQFPVPNFQFVAHTIEVFRIFVPKTS
jgi:hypothetical protein